MSRLFAVGVLVAVTVAALANSRVQRSSVLLDKVDHKRSVSAEIKAVLEHEGNSACMSAGRGELEEGSGEHSVWRGQFRDWNVHRVRWHEMICVRVRGCP